MAQIFRKSSNVIVRLVLVLVVPGCFLFWGVGYAVYMSSYTTDEGVPLKQPVPFSHEHHVAGLGLDCRYCHDSVERSGFAGMPATEVCMTCHSQVWRDAPVLEPVRVSYTTQRPLRWLRVNQTPDFVFFDHSVHVQNGIGCSTCHGRVDRMPITWKAHSLYMRWCLECHQAPERFLRQPDQIYSMDWVPAAGALADGESLLTKYGISETRLEQLRDCSMCHR